MNEGDIQAAPLPVRDGWEKAKILLQPVGGFLAALSVALIGIVANFQMNKQRSAAEEKDKQDRHYQLYADLQNRREQADSELRKNMFDSVLKTFLNDRTNPASSDIESDKELLNLELLVYNFHDTLNLKPLFLHLERKYALEKNAAHLDRLRKLGREISSRQARMLEAVGKMKNDFAVNFKLLNATNRFEIGTDETNRIFDITVTPFRFESGTNVTDPVFQIAVTRVDTQRQELEVSFQGIAEQHATAADFTLSFFDFPMIDNIRLWEDQRCALVLTKFRPEAGHAEGRLLYFDGYYSSLRDKAAFNEIFEKLKPEEKANPSQ